jgi:penicillin-binding protein 2
VIVPPADPNLETEQQVAEKPPLRDDTRFASSRVAVFQYAAVGIFLFLISGFWKLQIQNPQFYNERAQQNSIKSIPVLAPRGRILDRDGRVIVDNHSSFSLILSRETLKDEHVRPIADGLAWTTTTSPGSDASNRAPSMSPSSSRKSSPRPTWHSSIRTAISFPKWS